MLFMVIERFHNARAIYARVREQGRMLPDGLIYMDSWVDASLQRCFQLMQCEDPKLFQEWVARWQDLVEFEIVPIVPSKNTSETINSLTTEHSRSK